MKEIRLAEEGQGQRADPLRSGYADGLGTYEEAHGTGVLDSCNYSKGFVEIRSEYMNGCHPFSSGRKAIELQLL